ncbi:Alpha,alpha-trehalose-phosphate synthase [UDP-forming] 56 kDa subunit [Geodia barretti]|uniref:Alpha,alpha-trehalose-phosphate synthase [UDP-forming] 56 kDa subunit n=1 Tax=Geodia barretti TaxID=519541 RepID=A0AA35WZ05_GEOBA|nr:Alpha,alpha-trehalose-phosphate synthase [UDP-forming] 56 kDa subunit [Geodia barretti]
MMSSPAPAQRRPLVVVSNREPYQHFRNEDGAIGWSPTTGGVAVALDALMRERGGVWIAHGSGSADRDVVDDGDRIMVPPDSPSYRLRRLWLSADEASSYYEGFANEGLWPLCHEAHHGPHGGRVTAVQAVPIGVDYDRIQGYARGQALEADMQRLVAELRIETPFVGVGVDRLDYTKGIPERLEALDLLLKRRPDLRGRLTFVQIGVPSRSTIDSYMAMEQAIDQKVAEINARYPVSGGPIRYRKSALKIKRLVALYRLADFCVVSSLHDGMNLVAKEFVAARDDLDGVLVLSETRRGRPGAA